MAEGLEILNDSGKNNLILFIHGFTGNSKDTWSLNGIYYPQLFTSNIHIKDNYDVATFEYYTKLNGLGVFLENITKVIKSKVTGSWEKQGKNNPVRELCALLSTELQACSKNYDNIIFIAHSMGGLISKRYIVESLLDEQGTEFKFYSLAVPHGGACLANIGKIISFNDQVEDLAALSDEVTWLDQEWIKLIENVPSALYFYGTNDNVVPQNSARPMACDDSQIKAANADHISIAKPHPHTFSIYKLMLENLGVSKDKLPLIDCLDSHASKHVQKGVICLPKEEFYSFSENRMKNGSKEILDAFTRAVDLQNPKLSEKLIEIIEGEEYGKILLIEGEPGSGKSIVAQNILGLVLDFNKQHDLNFVPIYVNLMTCEKQFILGVSFEDSLREIENSLRDILAKGECFLIIDGIDFIYDFNNTFVEFLLKHRSINNQVLLKRSYKGIKGTKAKENLVSILPDVIYECGLDDNCLSFKSVSDVPKVLTSSLEKSAEEIFTTRELMSKWFFENRTNMRLYHMLLDDQTKPYPSESSIEYLYRFFHNYIKRFSLTVDEIREVNIEAQSIAYRILIKHDPKYEVSRIHTIAKRIATQSFEMMGYLSALYVCNKILYLGESNDDSYSHEKEINYIDHVHSYLVNKYAKQIITVSKEKERNYYSSIIHLYSKGSERLQAFLCYLLGRFTDISITDKSTSFLLKKKKDIDIKEEALESYPFDKLFHVLHRTIHISLIYLGGYAEKDYVKKIMSSSRLDSINRGFHRQYYGDADCISDPEMTLSDDTDLGDFTNTLKQISEKLNDKLIRTEQTINLSAYTFLSLCLSRYQNSTLEETIEKQKAIELIDTIIGNRKFQPYIIKYAHVVKDYLRSDLSPLIQSVINMYRLKKQDRNGWNYNNLNKKINRKVVHPDSVSEHTDFTVRLAQIFLPNNSKMNKLIAGYKLEENEYEDYDKYLIIELLINHDLGEWLHGDKVRMVSTVEDRKEEKFIRRQLT